MSSYWINVDVEKEVVERRGVVLRREKKRGKKFYKGNNERKGEEREKIKLKM